VRSGIALGLHQRNDDSAPSATRKELNSRIWWAHYSLERLVSNLTGRPSSTVGLLCSVPQPHPLVSEDSDEMTNESQSGDQRMRPLMSDGPTMQLQAGAVPAQQNLDFYAAAPEIASSGSYLRSILDLGNTTQAVLELYSVSAARESWESVQSMIAHHNDRLDAWATALPGGLNFLLRSNVEHIPTREQRTLDILYQSTKILITRPCLCRVDRRGSNQIAGSDTFSRRAALICVDAAKTIANLLPDATLGNLVALYQTGPWWQMVHVIMQAITVLCLQIALDATQNTGDCKTSISSLRKLFHWLRIMRTTNGMACRAHTISSKLVRKLVPTGRIVSSHLHLLFLYYRHGVMS
jgi:hypothetical protein